MTVRHFNDERAPEALHKANFIALAPFIFAAAKVRRPASLSDAPVQKISF